MLFYDDASVVLKYRLLVEGPVLSAKFGRIGQDSESDDGCFRLTWKEQDRQLKPTLRHNGGEDYHLETLELCASDADEGEDKMEKAAMKDEMNRRVVYGSEDLVKTVEKEYKVGAVIRLKGRPKKEENGGK